MKFAACLTLALATLLAAEARCEVDCGDGVDNDGDVAVDMEDNGCYSGGAIYYVSAAGNDAYDGLSPVHIGGSNGPKQTLGAVAGFLNTLQPGQKLLFRRGDSWVGNDPTGALYVNSIQGTSTAPVTIGAYGAGSRPTIRNSVSGTVFMVRSFAGGPTRWLVVRGLRLTTDVPHDGNPGQCIFLNESYHPQQPEHVTLSDMLIEDCGGGITNYANDFTLEDSVIRFNHNEGTPGATFVHGLFTRAVRTVVRNNEFERNGKYLDGFDHQIYVSSSEDVLIEGNRFHNSTDGVKLRCGRRLTVRANEFTGLAWASIIAGGDTNDPQHDLTITANYIHDVGGGITLKSQDGGEGHGLHNAVLSNNLFDTITRDATHLTHVLSLETDVLDGIAIHHNIFYNPVGDIKTLNIFNSNPTNVRISNNIFHRSDNVRPQPWIDPTVIQIESNPTLQGITFANNLYHVENGGITLLGVGSADHANLAAFRAAFPAQEAGGAEGNPQWADPANGDFHLTPASALAVDRGEAVFSVPADMDGTPRPQGAGFDIGPYERPGAIDPVPPAAPRGLRLP